MRDPDYYGEDFEDKTLHPEIYSILQSCVEENGSINIDKATKLLSDILPIPRYCGNLWYVSKKRESIKIDKYGKLMDPEKADKLGIKNGDLININGIAIHVKDGMIPSNSIFKVGDGFAKWVDYLSAYSYVQPGVELPDFTAIYKIGDPIKYINSEPINSIGYFGENLGPYDYDASQIYFHLYL